MPYSAKAVANLFLDLANAESVCISPMQMVKLVYLAHGWNLGFTNNALINEEVEAWQYGPVIDSLYHEFKQFGSGTIREPAVSYSFDKESLEMKVEKPQIPDSDNYTKTLIRNVWQAYKKYTGPQLSNITHMQGTPWEQTFRPHVRNILISDDVIAEHYKKLIQERKDR